MEANLQSILEKLTALIKEAVAEGHGEVVLKVTIQSSNISMIHLSKTQSIKVQQ